MQKSSGCKTMKSSSDRACCASTGRAVWQQQEEELGELGEQLDAEGDGLALGLDALDRLAPAADLLLLLGHHFTVWKWLSSELSQLTPHLPAAKHIT